MNPIWFLRAKRWAQNPPSWGKIKFVAAIIGFCLILYGFEAIWGWPDSMTVNKLRP